MEKALEILKQVKELSGWIKCGAELPFDEELDEAIAELEKFKENMKSLTDGVVSNRQGYWEAMKRKTCEGCKFFLVKNLGRTGYCNYMNDCCRFEKPDLYEPKDNA